MTQTEHADQTAPRATTPSRRSGLLHPGDLDSWHRWQARHRPVLQRVRNLRAPKSLPATLTVGRTDARVLVASDGSTPSLNGAVIDPLRWLDKTPYAVLDTRPRLDACGPEAAVHAIDVASETAPAQLAALLPELRCVVTTGEHLPLGALAHDTARRTDSEAFVVQHGLVTPYSPPITGGCTLLAWSDADGEFLCGGMDDVEVRVVGSQMLWTAAEHRAAPVDPADAPTFLGQCHAAELPRTSLFRVSAGFCRSTGATYRPHPSESDRVSRAGHLVMRAAGIHLDTLARPLAQIATPVAAIFSSGLVEAAAAGIPSWGYFPDPPRWVAEFWDRYGIAQWGSDPTPAPARPEIEPAVQIARILAGAVGGEGR